MEIDVIRSFYFMTYQLFQWKYISHKPDATMIIYAREQKTADEIIDIENIDNVFFFKKARFSFQKPYETNTPPYELEQHQLEVAEQRLEHRRRYFKEHPESLDWVKKR